MAPKSVDVDCDYSDTGFVYGAVLEHWIYGSWISQRDRVLPLIDPRYAREYARVPCGDSGMAERAVGAARQAVSAWAALPVTRRTDALTQVAIALRASADRIVTALRHETGKPEADARAEVEGSIDLLDWYAGLAAEVLAPRPNAAGVELRKPYGVAALIVPWNYPVAIALRSLPALLAAGNSVVWKPSEKTPLSATEIVRAIEHSGALPVGVLNLLLGDASAGAPLVNHPGVDLVVHTGSTATGRKVAEACGRLLRPAILELGGKDIVIVDRAVDVPAVASLVAAGAFENTGQICTSMERFLIHADVADDFLGLLVQEADNRNVGLAEACSDCAPVMGPLIDARQRDLVHGQVHSAREQGASVLSGGFIPDRSGFYYPATVMRDVALDTALWQDETFGPVAAVRTYTEFDEALAIANDSPYGLGATLFTQDEGAVSRAGQIESGIVWVNEWHASLAGGRFEPAGISGLGTVGPGTATLEAFSRAQQVRL